MFLKLNKNYKINFHYLGDIWVSSIKTALFIYMNLHLYNFCRKYIIIVCKMNSQHNYYSEYYVCSVIFYI